MYPVIDVDSLADCLDQVILLDARWRLGGPSTVEDFRAGHIPGASWVDLDRDFADPPGFAGRHPLPDPARLQQRLREFGVHDDSAVVAYDEADSTAAARIWWVLRWAGVEHARLLDGGLAAWTRSGRTLESGYGRERPPGTVTLRPGRLATLDAEETLRLARRGVLLDVRAQARYRGDVEPIDPVAGHIPGARSAPTTGNVGPDGHFLSPERLRRRFASLGVTPGQPAGAYCGSGVNAAHTVLALHLAGLDGVLYPGSWSEWITDPSRPVATGDESLRPAPGAGLSENSWL